MSAARLARQLTEENLLGKRQVRRAELYGVENVISGYMLFVAVGLSSVYLVQSLSFIATGQLPPIVTLTGHPTSVVFALDLSLLTPFLALGAIWLWWRRPWGFALAAILLVKGAVYTLVLTAGSLFAASAGVPGASAETPLWIVLKIMRSTPPQLVFFV